MDLLPELRRFSSISILMTMCAPVFRKHKQQITASKKEGIIMSSNWMEGIVSGGRLYCRKSPSKSAAYWGQFADGAKIQVKEISGKQQ